MQPRALHQRRVANLAISAVGEVGGKIDDELFDCETARSVIECQRGEKWFARTR